MFVYLGEGVQQGIRVAVDDRADVRDPAHHVRVHHINLEPRIYKLKYEYSTVLHFKNIVNVNVTCSS